MSSLIPPSDFGSTRGITVPTPPEDAPRSGDAPDAGAIFRFPTPLPNPLPQPESIPPRAREEAIERAHEKARQPPGGEAPDRAREAREKLEEASGKLKEAREAGVDLAKSGFWRRMIKVATAALTVAVAAALTAVSFGGAAPLLGIACASLVISAGDAVCAYRGWKNAEARAAGQPPPYDLPEGASCVKNLLHLAAKACGCSTETAQKIAKYGNAVITIGLAVAAFALGHATAALPYAHQVATLVGSCVNAALHGTIALRAMLEKEVGNSDMRRLARDALELGARALELDPELEGRTEDETRLLACFSEFGKPGEMSEREKLDELIERACKDFGDESVNAAISVAAMMGIGKSVFELYFA